MTDFKEKKHKIADMASVFFSHNCKFSKLLKLHLQNKLVFA